MRTFGPSFTAGLEPGQLLIYGLVGVAFFALIVVFSLWVSLRVILITILVLSVLQGFGPLGYMSTSVVITAALVPGVIWRTRHVSWDWWAWGLTALIGWQLLSVLWSFKLGSAAYGVLTSTALLAAYLVVRAILRENPEAMRSVLLWVSPVLLAEALAIIVFRFAPTVEASYLASPAARVLSEPGVEVLFSGGYENILDPDKAGGTLLNGNTAGLFMALCACVYAYVGCGTARQGWYLFATASLSFIAAISTGSKTPPAVIAILIVCGFLTFVAGRRPRIMPVALGGVVAVGLVVVWLISLLKPALIAEAVRTTGERGVLWGLVFQNVPEHWFLGLGFGNWREFMVDRVLANPQMAGDPTLRVLPPHNLFAQAWVDAGLVALVVTIALAIAPIAISARQVWLSRATWALDPATLRGALTLAGVSWALIHGLADTTTFSGDNHTIPWYAFLVATALARRGSGAGRECIEVRGEQGATRAPRDGRS